MSISNYFDLLHQEMINEIFNRLPTKSLGRCKCVSKSWDSLISDPHFIKTHLSKTPITNLILISDQSSLYSVHFDNNNPNCDGFASKLNFNCSSKYRCRVWGSCDGLILVVDDFISKFVLNPTTLEFKILPLLPSEIPINHNTCIMFGFGYDFSCDDYAVVVISYQYNFKTDACVYVYMLKTNQWKKVRSSPCDYIFQRCSSGIFLRGSLHWLAQNVNDSSWIITSFNIANEEFSQVSMLNGLFDSNLKILTLGCLNGRLCLITVVNKRTELWVMKDYGVVESWIKLPIGLTDESHVVPLHLPEDSLVVLECGQFALLSSNAKEVTLQDIKVLGLPHNFRVGMTFVDSLVSPNNKGENKKNT